MKSSHQKVLFVNGLPVDIGGIEKTIMEVYRGINHENLLIDFAVRKPEKGHFHDEIEAYGGRVFNLFIKTKHKGNRRWNILMDLYFIYSLYRLLKREGPYTAIHIANPLLDGFSIISAKLAKVPIRIAHSHNTGIDDKSKPKMTNIYIRKLRIWFCKRYATHIWGCSKAACEYLFGKGIMMDKRTEVVPNPINIKKFIDSQFYDKSSIYKELGVCKDNINLLHVGRYTEQKNQLFLLEVFAEMLRQTPQVFLIIIGIGHLEKQIKDRIIELKIERNVLLLDSKTDISKVLAICDAFLLPSIYEGFGNVLIEAQAAGVRCFASDACQPEANLGLIEYITLDRGAEYWAKYILLKLNKDLKDLKDLKMGIDHNDLLKFDLSVIGPKMEEVYLNGSKYNSLFLKKNER
ncbi:glycosyltransferase [Bacillus sp. HMF5848]|uniref:glycosyltransferase n=1 Tax=Bacillus sp. HMF5848 TaxID=2495421 RepID=UPI00163A4BCC|nr:glycosyltransferase [Bacillus sp. HMF5848]